jgi:hypothetical protein
MDASSPRAEEFKAEMATLKLRTGGASRERPLLAVGVLLMIAGVVLALVAYSAASNVKVTPGTNIDLLNSGEYTPLAIAGLALTVAGGFVFLRYSLARFLRFWLLRQSYEQQVALDRRAGDTVQ